MEPAKPSDEEDERWYYTPMSVFYRGWRNLRHAKCNSFRPTHETQAIIENERYKRYREERDRNKK